MRIKVNQRRNQIMHKIKYTIKTETNKQIDEGIKEIDKYKIDSSTCHQVMRKIKSNKPNKPLIINSKDGKKVWSKEGQVKLITVFSKQLFSFNKTTQCINSTEMGRPSFLQRKSEKRNSKSEEQQKL